MASIRAGFRKEQLTVQAKLQSLESELQAAKLDVTLAKRRKSAPGLQSPASEQQLA